MPTWRSFTKKAFRCGLYEAQDVLVEIDDVDLIPLDMTWAAWFKEPWLRTPLYHDVSRKLIFANPGLKKVRLTKDYDVFIAACNTYWDLPNINAIERWKDHCKVSICWIDEMWAWTIPLYKYWLDALKPFDYVFIGLKGSVPALSKSVSRSCHWLPGGVDALRFSPFPSPPDRVIDVYRIGRGYHGIHREVLNAADRGELFYIHDTLATADTEVYDHRRHRDLFASVAKRSRYFVVAPAKMDRPYETQGQLELGYRYYEGAAAGTVMIGDAPNCEAFNDLFGWEDAVIQIRPDGSDVMDVLRSLDSDPERMAAIGRRNAMEALRRHDWMYRWKEMFRIAGVEPSAGMAARERRLREVSDLAATADADATRRRCRT